MTTDTTLREDERQALLALVKSRGESAAARHLEISESTVARALAGLNLRRATRTVIRARLGELTTKTGGAA